MIELTKALGPLTKKFVWEYITSSSISLLEIKSIFLYALRQLIRSLYDVFLSILVILIYILLAVAKLSVILFPFVQMFTKIIIEWHYTLNRSDIIIEFITLTVILFFFIFQKRIVKFWHELEVSVSAKFRYMVRLAPHILFFTFSGILAIIGQKILMPFASLRILPTISLGIPVIKTLRIISFQSEEQYRIYSILRDQLLVWVVLGAYHALATTMSTIPLSKKILNILPYCREISLVVLIWIQLSPLFAKIVFEASLPLLKAVALRIPASDIGLKQTSGILSGLKYMRMISVSQEDFIKSVFREGTALMIVIFFLLTPSPIASIGVVIIAFLFPIFRTYKYIYDNDEIVATPMKRKPSKDEIHPHHDSNNDDNDNSNNNDISIGQEQLRKWLRYWICLGGIWLSKIYITGFWPSILMLLTLWLQHSYLDGAKRVFRFFTELFDGLKERHERIRKERQSQGQILQEIQKEKEEVEYEENTKVN